MKAGNIIKLAVSVAICLLAGFIGSLFNAGSIATWYASLNKPAFNPPDWIFAPVWTALFVLMGISLFIAWSKGLKSRRVRTAMWIFGMQLALNIFWSFFFFYLQSPFFALIEIVILWTFILLTILQFRKISDAAAWLLLPYILWVSFAVLLNASILFMNL